MSPLSAAALAIVEGRHSDPFRYLAPHHQGDDEIVRVVLPDPEEVVANDQEGHQSELHRVHDAGLFSGPVDGGSKRYRLRARFGDSVVDLDDPYRFPPILSDFDLYLLGEGNHLDLYHKLGAHPTTLD